MALPSGLKDQGISDEMIATLRTIAEFQRGADVSEAWHHEPRPRLQGVPEDAKNDAGQHRVAQDADSGDTPGNRYADHSRYS